MDNEQKILEPSLYVVKALLILDSDGNRLIAKEQKAFERSLFSKTSKASGEIILIDGLTCVYKSNVDLYFYVAGSSHENELMLTAVLNCLYDATQKVLGKSFEKRNFMDNLDSIFLIVDEIVDGGIICEIDPDSVTQRAAIRTEEQLPLGEQTVAQVLQTAKEQLRWSLLK
ncbi:coatomer subunit zeta-1-like isoform X2 [Paramacrobiotus metropolitanus]|uniref:coatomer subunit zeta-1-like isoform X2 n=1 Tax=Paramacrobiotus metropolitanus TaxID=2943436 RepID=UPI002445E2C9|nr:coatomer subunit zeta-1-like isoform X2 [Paramacrobiotus metropolitanus]